MCRGECVACGCGEQLGGDVRVVVEAGGGEGYEGCGEEHGSAYSHDVGE